MLDEPAKFGFGFDVFVPGEAHFGQVVLVLGADGGTRHEGPGRVVLVAEQPEAVGQGGGGHDVVRDDDDGIQLVQGGDFDYYSFHFVNHGHVEAGEGLIEQDEVVGAEQLLGDGRPLALPAREQGRVLAAVRGQAEAFEVGCYVLAGGLGGVFALGGHQQVIV